LNDLECPIQLNVRMSTAYIIEFNYICCGMSHGLLADSVDTSLASLLIYIVVKQVRCSLLSEEHDQ